MRRARRLIPGFLLLILSAVGWLYHQQKSAQQRAAPDSPQALPRELNATARDWEWSHHEGDRPVVEVRARDFRQLTGPDRIELDRVDLRLYKKNGKEFDHVRCARAQFDQQQKTLYSEGDVEITMAVPAEGPPRERLVRIQSSGVTFDSTTGKATTSRLSSFQFDRGEGQAVGADYDPSTRELHLHSQVSLVWRGKISARKTMRVESGELFYNEAASQVVLRPWSRLRRDNLVLDAGASLVTLEQGAIRRVEAVDAKGSDQYPNRQIEYAARELEMLLSEDSVVEKINARREARLLSLAGPTRTEVTADSVTMDFDTAGEESTLREALAVGQARAESRPLVSMGDKTPYSRVLTSQSIGLKMRPGGRELEQVATHDPGAIDFLPNRPGQRRRRMEGERIWITYGPENRIQNFRSVRVATRTEPDGPRKNQPPALTWSKDLEAHFDLDTGEMRQIEQWEDFRYQEGDRHARADRASMESIEQRIRLMGSARVWDPTGSTDARQILLDQKTGDFVAEGEVRSTRQPERKGRSSAMLDQERPVQATADRMTSSQGRRRIVYEGHALMWQGANRLEAGRIEIDRAGQILAAKDKVFSQFSEKAKAGSAPAFTLVRAPEMVYRDADRLAHYRGGAWLQRPGLELTADQIRAYLKESQSDTSLDRTYADGQVRFLRTADGRELKGSAEHAEYYLVEDYMVLYGGEPQLVDSRRGATRGRRLAYYAKEDRLLVEGGENRPAVSRLRRK